MKTCNKEWVNAQEAESPTFSTSGINRDGMCLPLQKALIPRESTYRLLLAKQATKTSAHKEAIVVYLTNNVSAKCAEISALIGVSVPRTRAILFKMVEDNIIVAEGENKNRIYKLKF